MTTRVRRRRPRVPPRKGRQPLPQFGAGSPVGDELRLRSLNSLLRLMGEKQIGGRLTPRQMSTLMRATDPKRLGIFPKRGQRGAGILSVVAKAAGRAAARASSKVATRAAKKLAAKLTKAATKQLAKKVAKKAATGAVAGGAGWATTKFFDKYI